MRPRIVLSTSSTRGLGLAMLGLILWLGLAVIITHSEAQAPSPSQAVPAGQEILDDPWLVVTPTVLWAQLPAGEMEVQTLLAGNKSPTMTLVYTVSAVPVAQGEGIVPWLDVTPTMGTIPTGTEASLTVTFDASGQDAGYLGNASLVVNSNSLVAPAVITVPAFLEVIEATVAPVVTPTFLSANVGFGGGTQQNLALGNHGNATMVFTLSVATDPALETVPWLDVEPVTGTVPAGQEENLTAAFDASGLLAGQYTTGLYVLTNSPVTPAITVPVTMTIDAPAHHVGPIFDGGQLDYQPSILRVQPDGRLMIVFERLNTATLFGDLYVTTSDDGGQSWSVPTPAIDSTLNERHPALVQLGDGSFALFYLVDETGAGSYRIHRATSADGSAWLDQGAIDLGWVPPGEINPSVIREAGGTLTMTYHRLNGPSFISQSTNDGLTWDTAKTQVSYGSAALPRVAKRERDGMYIVTYQVNPGSDDLDLYAKVSADPGDWSGDPIPLSTAINSHDSQPIVLEDGAFLVVYAKAPVNYFDVFYRLSCDGVNWSDEVQVTHDPAHYDTQPHPLLHGLPGHVILAWSHQDGGTPYDDHDVWVDNDLELRPSLCGASKHVAPEFMVPALRPLTYTLQLPNIGLTTTVSLVDPIPDNTAYEPGSLWASSGSYGYDTLNDAITWDGTIARGQEVTIRFQVSTTALLSDGDEIDNTTWFTDGQDLAYQVAARATVDALPPTSQILDPQHGQFTNAASYLISGEASDAVSGVEGVEVSIDGSDWQPATGQESWTFLWEGLTEGVHNLRSRARDALGHDEIPGPGIGVTVDFTPPVLEMYWPADGAEGVPVEATLILTFSEPMLPGGLEVEAQPALPGLSVSWNPTATVAYVSHDDLAFEQTYAVSMTQALDRASNPAQAVAWSFTTEDYVRVYLPVVFRNQE